MSTNVTKRVTKPAPKAPLRPLNVQPDPGSALEQVVAKVTENASLVAEAFAAANDITDESASYKKVLAASVAAGLTWDAAALWVPEDVKVGEVPGTGEALIRHLHAVADPSTCEAVVSQTRELTQLAVDASSEENVLEARRLSGSRVLPLHSEGRDPVAALKDLTSRYNAATKVGVTEAAEVKVYVDAVDDVAGLMALARKLGSKRQNYSRFRSRLFTHLVDREFCKIVPEQDRGGNYRAVANTAKAAHAAFMKQDGQARSVAGVAGLAAYVNGKVREELEKKFDVTKITAPPSASERKSLILANVQKYIRKAVANKLITRAGADGMLSWLTTATDDTFGNAYELPVWDAPKAGNKKAPAAPKTTSGKKGAAKPSATKPATPKKNPVAPAPVAPVPTRRQVPATAPTAQAPKSRTNVARSASASAGGLMADLKR